MNYDTHAHTTKKMSLLRNAFAKKTIMVAKEFVETVSSGTDQRWVLVD